MLLLLLLTKTFDNSLIGRKTALVKACGVISSRLLCATSPAKMPRACAWLSLDAVHIVFGTAQLIQQWRSYVCHVFFAPHFWDTSRQPPASIPRDARQPARLVARSGHPPPQPPRRDKRHLSSDCDGSTELPPPFG